MTAAMPLPEPQKSYGIVSAEDVECLEHAEDAYLVRLACEALAEIEAGAPTNPWEQFKAELEGDR